MAIDNKDSYNALTVFHFNRQLKDQNFINTVSQVQFWLTPTTQYFEVSLQAFQSQQNKTVQILANSDILYNAYAQQFGGTIFKLKSVISMIQKSQNNFFDLLENVWSFATICFGLLLAKASKYCNIHKKNNEISTEKTESQ